jgi:hypothetical protein
MILVYTTFSIPHELCVSLLVYTTFSIPHDVCVVPGVHHVIYIICGIENMVYTSIMWYKERGVHQYHVV